MVRPKSVLRAPAKQTRPRTDNERDEAPHQAFQRVTPWANIAIPGEADPKSASTTRREAKPRIGGSRESSPWANIAGPGEPDPRVGEQHPPRGEASHRRFQRVVPLGKHRGPRRTRPKGRRAAPAARRSLASEVPAGRPPGQTSRAPANPTQGSASSTRREAKPRIGGSRGSSPWANIAGPGEPDPRVGEQHPPRGEASHRGFQGVVPLGKHRGPRRSRPKGRRAG